MNCSRDEVQPGLALLVGLCDDGEGLRGDSSDREQLGSPREGLVEVVGVADKQQATTLGSQNHLHIAELPDSRLHTYV